MNELLQLETFDAAYVNSLEQGRPSPRCL